MKTTDDLTWGGLWAFLYKQYSAESLKQFLGELVDDGRYGDVMTLEKQAPAIEELRALGLGPVAEILEQTLPHPWQLPHPYSHRIWDDDRERLVREWQTEMAELKAANEAQDSPRNGHRRTPT